MDTRKHDQLISIGEEIVIGETHDFLRAVFSRIQSTVCAVDLMASLFFSCHRSLKGTVRVVSARNFISVLKRDDISDEILRTTTATEDEEVLEISSAPPSMTSSHELDHVQAFLASDVSAAQRPKK
jgi:hypothetical protein